VNIDVHWHYIPESYIDAVRRGNGPSYERTETDDAGREWIAFGPMRHPLVPEMYLPEAQLAEMTRRRIDIAAVSPSPTLFQYDLDPDDGLALHRTANDAIADLVAAYPRRFVGLATVPLQDPGVAISELERAMKVNGLRGVEIGTHVGGRNLDDPELRPFFQAAEELGAFVFVLINNYIRSVPGLGHIGISEERFHTVIGVIFLVIILLSPGGLMGILPVPHHLPEFTGDGFEVIFASVSDALSADADRNTASRTVASRATSALSSAGLPGK